MKLNAKVVSKNNVGFVRFEAEHVEAITEDAAKRAQLDLGYHPNGYGFYEFKVDRDPVLLRYKATWACQVSCD